MIKGFFQPPHMRLLLAASFAVNLLALALPLMTMQVYNRILSNHAVDTFLVLATGVAVAAVMEFVLRVARSAIAGISAARFEHHAAAQALEHLMNAEPRAYEATAPAVLAQQVGAVSRLKDYYGGQMAVTLLVDIPFVAVFIMLAFYLAGWLALVPCAVLGVFGWASLRQGLQLKQLMQERETQDDQRYSFITDTLQSVHTVKALCLEAVTARRFEETQRQSGKINYDIACMQGQTDTVSFMAAQVMTVLVIGCGAPLVVAGSISVGTLIACVLLAGQIMQPLQRGLALWTRHQDVALAKKRLTHLLTIRQRDQLAFGALGANHGVVKLDGVRFSYRPGAPILDGVKLDIAPGDTVVIRGEPGSGKTTLLELMAGIYTPDKGRVLLSGMEVSAVPVSERSSYIAYLPTRGMILRGSIMDNLMGYDPRLQSQTQEIASLLGIEDAVALLPSGYDTPLEGLTADLIPPGLKQRIAIARALLHKPRLVLFDNADQGLDKESYTCIFNLLARLKTRATLVLVSEDRNVASLADQVWELRRGQLVPLVETSPVVADRRHLQEVLI